MTSEDFARDRLPVAAEHRHRIERTMEAALDARGALKAQMRERAYGAMAAEGRAVFKALEPSTYREWLSATARGISRVAHCRQRAARYAIGLQTIRDADSAAIVLTKSK